MGWRLWRRVRRRTLPIHLFIHFCCGMYRLATMHSITDRQTDRRCQYVPSTMMTMITATNTMTNTTTIDDNKIVSRRRRDVTVLSTTTSGSSDVTWSLLTGALLFISVVMAGSCGLCRLGRCRCFVPTFVPSSKYSLGVNVPTITDGTSGIVDRLMTSPSSSLTSSLTSSVTSPSTGQGGGEVMMYGIGLW